MIAARRHATKRPALAALAALAAALPGAASAERRVIFAPFEPRAGDVAEVSGRLTRPPGAGPFPAVALLHSCLGLPRNERAIAGTIASWGYVALFVDDFAGRRLKQTCAVDFAQGRSDAFGALAFLAALPYVDPKRIAAVGYSQGADTALAIAASPQAAPSGAQFKAVAAFYPPCANQAGAQLRTPTLILVGGSDEVTPAADCERLAEAQAGALSNVSLAVYANAAHGFDMPEFEGGKRVLGMWLQYDRDAAARSRTALRDFLAAKLAR